MILHARTRGKVSSVRELLRKLEVEGGLYLSDAVVAEALRLANEV